MTQQIALRISDELASKFDQIAQRFGSRSEALRVAIEEFVSRECNRAIDDAIRSGYERIPVGSEDDWGSLDMANELAATLLARALDNEDGGW